ncbi:methanogenesis marker 17 protein [Methanobacterium petrolearium]|uniref:methanogenesis marker 17 protein n=1 Tax=Methanobacterium petrolearium TaxID=710190 RepID=UPI001AE9CBF7|nr:methanogenesis marker 17 protein [Methanobacterium petrolearium]MBP1945631.1 putative methanogenesis marker protein 17 [Methanobacterium petrolearium]BDZ71863.1 methanogenesis marker 17 protein [Methanobacterium petrolearium]
MQVECYDESGREVYDMILRQILQDVQIVRAVKDVRIYIDPRDPIFIIAIQYQKTAPPVLLDDFAEYKYDAEANEAFIRIEDENYLPELLKKLWEIEGRNKIHQPSRYEVIIDDPQIKLEGLVVHDPEEDLKKKIYDALFRIVPEGFRVMEHFSEGNIIALTCSDEYIKEEYLEKTREIIKEMKETKKLYEVTDPKSPAKKKKDKPLKKEKS